MKLNIVVPTYNTEAWIQRCLYSIQTQSYKNFSCVIYNDASTDRTAEAINSFVAATKDERFVVIHNSSNKKALHNIVDGFKFLRTEDEPESVLMVIDGDDYLFSEYSLELLASAYAQTGCLLSYGNHIHWPTGETRTNCEKFPDEVVANNSYRDYKFITSHLRTWKSKLWNSIKDEDLRDLNGEYFKTGWDVSFMIPMLEMAAGRHLFIPNVLYVYNRWNPISDDRIYADDQGRVDKLVRTRDRYKVLHAD